MLTDMTLGQYYPGDSFLHRMDPRAKILCTMIFIIAIFLANNPFSYLLVAAFTLGAISVSGVPYKLVWRAVKPLWFILLFTLATHVFTTPGTELFSWKFIHISEEGIRNGVEMTLRLVFLIAFTSLLTYTTSPIVLTDGIEALLMPFKRIGVPAHELAMMMTIALRFIPTLLEETDRIMKAQSSRGADFVNGQSLAEGEEHGSAPRAALHFRFQKSRRPGDRHGSALLQGRRRTHEDAPARLHMERQKCHDRCRTCDRSAHRTLRIFQINKKGRGDASGLFGRENHEKHLDYRFL